MSSADHAVADLHRSVRVGAHRRRGEVERVRAARRWTVGVLGVGTVALLVYATLLVAMAWLLGSVFEAVTAREPVQVDLLAVAADVAPVLLLGWCSGMATSASIARGETLGARTAGVVSGTVGIVAALLVMRLTGLL